MKCATGGWQGNDEAVPESSDRGLAWGYVELGEKGPTVFEEPFDSSQPIQLVGGCKTKAVW